MKKLLAVLLVGIAALSWGHAALAKKTDRKVASRNCGHLAHFQLGGDPTSKKLVEYMDRTMFDGKMNGEEKIYGGTYLCTKNKTDGETCYFREIDVAAAQDTIYCGSEK